MDRTDLYAEGKTIKLFLADGNPKGILVAEISNWTGKVLVAPRSQLEKVAKRPDIEKTGVYVLVGDDPQSSTRRDRVYIGEGDNILSRLTRHNSDPEKDFWVTTLAITSKDESLTKAHGRYLESRMIQLTVEAGRASVQNSTNPDVPKLPESDRSDMEVFLKQLLILLPVLGFSFMVPVPASQDSEDSQIQTSAELSPVFQYNSDDFQAEAREIDGVFVVFAGSRFRGYALQSLSPANREYREQLIKDGKIVLDDQFYVLRFNLEFSSPSAAACIVSGTTVNGRNAWTIKGTKQTYSSWNQERLNRVSTLN